MSKSRTSLIIVFSVLFFTIMLRNHSYLPHRYSIRFARGQNLELL